MIDGPIARSPGGGCSGGEPLMSIASDSVHAWPVGTGSSHVGVIWTARKLAV